MYSLEEQLVLLTAEPALQPQQFCKPASLWELDEEHYVFPGKAEEQGLIVDFSERGHVRNQSFGHLGPSAILFTSTQQVYKLHEAVLHPCRPIRGHAVTYPGSSR